MKAGRGFAVVQDGTLEMNSIYSTRRGAIVNFLVFGLGIHIYGGMTDEEIEQIWDRNRGEAAVYPVTITVSGVSA